MDKVKVGIIGCGNISGAYLKFSKLFPAIEVAAVADIDMTRAQNRAKEFSIPKACMPAELLAQSDIEIVVNLTIPKAHGIVAKDILNAGKHAYNEKPLALSREEGKELLTLAKSKKLRLGAAPDTFFGAGHQTARKLIDDGAIGKPIAGTAFMCCHGHETWHPDPEFYYKAGGGPMLDMGPYYLTALQNMLGQISRVCGFASVALPERTITHKNAQGGPGHKFGQKIAVETPDHIAGTIEFASGAVVTIITSFAITKNIHDGNFPITIWGTEGALAVPDPNGFDGAVKIAKGQPYSGEWENVPLTHTTGYGRMVGVVDMAYAIRSKRPHRASAEQVFCTLDAMLGFLDSSKTGKATKIKTKYKRPAPLPVGLPMGVLDE